MRTCYFHEDLEEALQRLGFLEGSPTEAPLNSVQGRTSHQVYAMPAPESPLRRVLWKQCRRGGMVEPVLKDRHWSVRRFLKEMVLTDAARRAGVSVAPTLAVAVVPCGGGWKRVEILCEMIDDADDLEGLLATPTPDRHLRREVIQAVAGELRRFHGSGFSHGDLNVKNVLWRASAESAGIDVTLIDLDPGSNTSSSPQGNLLRLYRSYLKGAAAGRWTLTRLELLRFVNTYFAGDRVGMVRFLRRAQRMLSFQSVRRLRWGLRRRPTTTPNR